MDQLVPLVPQVEVAQLEALDILHLHPVPQGDPGPLRLVLLHLNPQQPCRALPDELVVDAPQVLAVDPDVVPDRGPLPGQGYGCGLHRRRQLIGHVLPPLGEHHDDVPHLLHDVADGTLHDEAAHLEGEGLQIHEVDPLLQLQARRVLPLLQLGKDYVEIGRQLQVLVLVDTPPSILLEPPDVLVDVTEGPGAVACPDDPGLLEVHRPPLARLEDTLHVLPADVPAPLRPGLPVEGLQNVDGVEGHLPALGPEGYSPAPRSAYQGVQRLSLPRHAGLTRDYGVIRIYVYGLTASHLEAQEYLRRLLHGSSSTWFFMSGPLARASRIPSSMAQRSQKSSSPFSPSSR